MPSEHFFKLKPDKQNNIIRAATREFAKNDYNEVSIRKIAQEARISRGSFYLYFTDKEDIYFTVILAYKDRLKNELMNIYQHGKSLSDVVLQIFDYFTHLSQFEHMLFERISANMNASLQEFFAGVFQNFEKELSQRMLDTLAARNVSITPEIKEQVNLIREIMFGLLLSSFAELGIGSYDTELIRKRLKQKLEIVYFGTKNLIGSALEDDLIQ